MIFIFIAGSLQLFSLSLIGRLIDHSVTSVAALKHSGINLIILQIMAVMLLQSLFSVIQQYCFLQMNETAITNIRKTLYYRYLRYPLAFFNRERVGDLISRINNDLGMIQYIFSEQLPTFLYQSVILIVAVSTLFLINTKLTLLMVITFPITVLATWYISKKVKSISKQIQDAFAVSVIVMEEKLQKIRTVKAFSKEKTESNRYNVLLDNIVSKSIKRSVLKMGLDGFSSVLMIAAQVLIIWYGSILVANSELTIGKMITFMMVTFSVGAAVSSIVNAFSNLQKSFGSTERLYDLLTQLAEEDDENNQRCEPVSFHDRIVFSNVSFSYFNKADELVLSDLNFEVRKGERIGIIGPSGVGKSTITQLLLRFYHVTAGHIYLDGYDVKTFSLSGYRRLFGIVSQEVELFGSTIRENICYGNPEATEEEMTQAAKRASAHQFITELPAGYNTVLGDNGYTLSGGQRQRIAIARAMLTDPKILILDEATSALDTTTELQINEALEELMKQRTTIIVSHRLSTIRKMNRIMVFHQKGIIESGTHEYLMTIPNGKYREINLIQEGLFAGKAEYNLI